MRVSKTSKKPLVLSMALMVLMALVIPFAGVASAQAASIDLRPQADTAATETCNEFTADVNEADGTAAEGETVTIRAAQSDADQNQDLEIAFCDPNAGTTEQGEGAGLRQGNTATGAFLADCDDNVDATGDPLENDGGCATAEPITSEAPAVIDGVCTTRTGTGTTEEAAGECTFGVTSNEPGDMIVEACVTDQLGRQICDQSLKTWVAGGEENVAQLDCEPETDTNPEETEHVITCTATNADGFTLANIEVDAVVQEGPNQGTRLTCGQANRDANGNLTGGGTATGQTNNEGQVDCFYTDANDDETGTDTIVAFVDQDGDNQVDANEPQDTVLKTWFGEARNINCEPETASNTSGTQHVVTCTVTDREGQPVAGETVTFTEQGPGRFDPSGTATTTGGSTTTATTNEQGVATATVTTFENEEGIQDITGSLTTTADADPNTAGDQPDECERLANDPTGAPAGVCADSVVKNWVAAGEAQPECNDGVDNDGDGRIDFPDDRGCTSVEDNTEGSEGAGGGEGPTRGPCEGFGFGTTTPKPDGSGSIIVGTPEDDLLAGTDGDDIICGLGGDDVIDGEAGSDQIVGNAGNDEIDGGAGRDQMRGGNGRDAISGRRGNDVLLGGGDNDTLKGNAGFDTLKGHAGNDTLQGGRGEDTLIGGAGDDTIRGWTQDDILKGGAGSDILHGGRGIDICRGGRGRDTIRACERR